MVSLLFVATNTGKAVVRMGRCWCRCGAIFPQFGILALVGLPVHTGVAVLYIIQL